MEGKWDKRDQEKKGWKKSGDWIRMIQQDLREEVREKSRERGKEKDDKGKIREKRKNKERSGVI